MRRRNVLVVTGLAFVAFGIACVDLFHDTDFETLCTRTPSDPQCGGDAGRADVAVETGVDARRPHPDFCKWSSAEARVQALRACAWLGACEGPLGEETPGNVLGPCAIRAQLAYDCTANPALRPAGDTDELWSCLATAKTCGDVDQCVFPAGLEPCKAVPTGVFFACGALQGAPRIRCERPVEGRATGVEPCALRGKTCTRENESRAECTGSQGYTCTTTGCVGNAAVDCEPVGTSTRDRGIDCRNVGDGTCVPSDGGAAPACAPSRDAAPCAVDTPPACVADDAGIVASCVAGKEIRVNCSFLGLPCDDSKAIPAYDPAAACRIPAGAGVCTDDSDKCVGTRLQSCGRGAPYEVDCVSVGLAGCKAEGGRAACAPPP
jgi:hypothetical protein